MHDGKPGVAERVGERRDPIDDAPPDGFGGEACVRGAILADHADLALGDDERRTFATIEPSHRHTVTVPERASSNLVH